MATNCVVEIEKLYNNEYANAIKYSQDLYQKAFYKKYAEIR